MGEPPTDPRGAFVFLPVDTVAFGRGALDRLPAEVERLGCRRAFVVTTSSLLHERALLERVERLLGPRHVGTFGSVRQHTPSADVWAASEQARHAEADLVVSFGGSTVNDCSKLVAYLLGERMVGIGELLRCGIEHRGLSVSGDLPPHVAIPTTLSAGEFTTGASITDEATRVKGTVSHTALAPRVVLLDPSVTVATPEWLWLSSGIKALDHAVERFYSPLHQPLVDVLCLEAIRLLTRYLPSSRATTEEGLAARGQCQIAAWLSAFGWANVRVGLSHILGHQIGGRCGVPHGYTSCITMPHVIRFVHHWAPDRLVPIAEALGLRVDERTAGDAVAQAVARLVADLGLPGRLRDVGVPREALDALIDAAVHEVESSEHLRAGLAGEIRREDVAQLVRAAW